MIRSLAIAASPLDDFLGESTSSTETGELLQQLGLLGSLLGVTVAAGLMVFLVVVHRGTRREVAVLLQIAALAGGITLVGAAVELAGVASIGLLSWGEALTDGTGSAAMMRLLAGLMIVLGLFDQTAPVDEVDNADEGDEADLVDLADLAEASKDSVTGASDGNVRWVPGSASAFGLVGAALGVISFWFDGHTVSEGPRALHAIVSTAHVSAGSVWFGGVIGLVVVTAMRRSGDLSPVPDIVRLSVVASWALVIVALAGSLMTLFIIDGFSDLTSTDWGRLLLIKVAAVGVAAAIGGYNHFVVVPALERSTNVVAMAARARLTLRAEAVILVFVVAATVLLTTASTN